jgi:hypothetical protein
MSKQSKSKSKKPNGLKVEEDDDWENVLEAEMTANNIESKSLINQKITSPTKVNAEVFFSFHFILPSFQVHKFLYTS